MMFAAPMPFEDALAAARDRGLLPTSLSSARIAELSADLRRRSVFSARVADADFLQKVGDLVENISGGLAEDGLAAGETGSRMVSITEAKAQLAEYLDRINYQAHPDDADTIKDLRSDARLQLIVETQVLDRQGAGRYESGMDEDTLDTLPAWELIRMIPAKIPRDWEARWQDAGGGSDGSTDAASGRMVALKTHPVWQALGEGAGGYEDTLGNPHPPFAFNSGMGVVDIPRAEARELGIIGATTKQEPQLLGNQEGAEVRASRFSESLQAALSKDPDLEIHDGALRSRRAA